MRRKEIFRRRNRKVGGTIKVGRRRSSTSYITHGSLAIFSQTNNPVERHTALKIPRTKVYVDEFQQVMAKWNERRAAIGIVTMARGFRWPFDVEHNLLDTVIAAGSKVYELFEFTLVHT